MTAPKYFSSNINLIYPSDSVQFTGVTSPYSSVCVGELIGGYAFNKWFDAPSDSAGNFIIDVNIDKPIGTYHLVAVPNSGFYCDSSQPSNEIALVVRERASPPGQIILNSVEWVTPSSLQSQIRLKINPNGAFQTFIKIDNDAEELVFVLDGTTTLVTTHNYSTYISHNVCAGEPPNQCRTLNPIVPDMPCSPPGGVQRKCNDANTIAVWNQVNCRYDTAPCGVGNRCENGDCVPDTNPTGCSPPCSTGTHCENNNCIPDTTGCIPVARHCEQPLNGYDTDGCTRRVNNSCKSQTPNSDRMNEILTAFGVSLAAGIAVVWLYSRKDKKGTRKR